VARPRIALTLALVALAAGCGGDEDSDEPSSPATATTQATTAESAGPPVGNRGGRAAADAFVACFKEPGFRPIRNASVRQPAEVIAEERGYDVEGLLMTSGGGVNSFFVQFFDSEDDREEATETLDLKFGSADVPQSLERGSAAVTFVTKQVRDDVGDAVERCLG
jgi:hypothetical protein